MRFALVALVACGAPAPAPIASHVAAPPIDAAGSDDPAAVLASLRADLDDASHDCATRNAVAVRYLSRVRALDPAVKRLPPDREAAVRRDAGNLAMGYAAHSQDCYGKPTVGIDALVDALADVAH